MSTETQLNVRVPQEIDDTLERLTERHGWSKRQTAALAVRTLDAIMGAHERYATQHDPDIGELYMRLAREMPSDFIETPKDGVVVGRMGDQPAIQVANWVITALNGDLMAEEMDGERRIGKVVDGEIRPLRMPAAFEAAHTN